MESKILGNFENNTYKITIAENGMNCKILCNGEELKGVQSIKIVMNANDNTKVEVQTVCF